MTGRTLTPADVEAIAEGVAALVNARPRYLDTSEVAEYVGCSIEWVREHAAELGGIRVGDSPRGALRFERGRVEGALERRRLQRDMPAPTQTTTTRAAVGFRKGTRVVRIKVPHKLPDADELRKKATRARTTERKLAIIGEAEEQEAKRIWRVIAWNLKARMEAVEEGVETFEEAFLAHLLDERTGETFYETLSRDGKIDLGEPLLALQPSDPR